MTDINEQMGVLMEDKKSHSVAFNQLVSERRNATGYIKGLCDQRDEQNQKMQARIAERRELIFGESGATDGWKRIPPMCHFSDFHRESCSGSFERQRAQCFRV